MNENVIICGILNELEKAQIKHPNFPTDIVHMVAIMAEEAGECVQSALNCYYEDSSTDLLDVELMQTAAMCIRILLNRVKTQEV